MEPAAVLLTWRSPSTLCRKLWLAARAKCWAARRSGVGPIGQLKDYSGAFAPTITWNDFTRETILDGLDLYRRLFLAIDGFWYLAVKDRCGENVAMSCDLWVWDKYIRYELRRLTKVLNIVGSDLEALFKALQMSPWAGNLEFVIDFQGGNCGRLRITKCPTLQALVKEGQGRERYFCREVEQPMFEMYARYFDREIKVIPLRIPPETLESEVCCEWEFRKGD